MEIVNVANGSNKKYFFYTSTNTYTAMHILKNNNKKLKKILKKKPNFNSCKVGKTTKILIFFFFSINLKYQKNLLSVTFQNNMEN